MAKLFARANPDSYKLYDKDPDDPDVPIKAIVELEFEEDCLDEVPLDGRGVTSEGDCVVLFLNLDTNPLKDEDGNDRDVAPIDFSIKTLRTLGMTNDDLSDPDGIGEALVEVKFRNGWPQVWALRENVLDSEKAQAMTDAFAAAFARADKDDDSDED